MDNGCVYTIKKYKHAKSRSKNVHKQNLKTYFDRGLSQNNAPPTQTQDNDPENIPQVASLQAENNEIEGIPGTQEVKRKYNKNPNNPRWNRPVSPESSASSDESGVKYTLIKKRKYVKQKEYIPPDRTRFSRVVKTVLNKK